MMNYNLNSIGEYIRLLRKEKGFTQQQLADLLHVSKPAVSQWENGKGIKTEYLYELSRVLDVSVTELIQGKSKDETIEEFIDRNFNIERYDFDEPICQNNLDQLEIFYHHILLVKNCFFQLLLPWALDSLSEDEKAKFLYLKKYFKFDGKYGAYLMEQNNVIIFIDEKKEKQIIRNVMNEMKNCSKEEQEWELSKLYNWNYDIKEKEVLESGNLKALEFYLSVLLTPEKDALLNSNLKIEETIEHDRTIFFGSSITKQTRKRTIEEIEKISFFKVMLNNGCQCVFEYDPHIHPLEDEDLELIDGNIQDIYTRAIEDFNQPIFFNPDVYKIWKTLSLKEYRECIDDKKTVYLKAVVNYKENEPLKYYHSMIEYYES